MTIQRGLLQGRYRPSAQSFPENAGLYGSDFAGTSVGSASHATHPVLAEAEGSILGLASRTPPHNGDSGLCISPGSMEGTLLAKARCDPRHGAQKEGCHKGWGALCEGKPTFGLWSEEKSGLHINCLEMLAVCQACPFCLPDIQGHHMLICSDSRSVVSYINYQGCLVLKRLCRLANNLLVWAQNNLCSLKVTHVPGKMNRHVGRSRHVVEEQCHFRGMDAPPARGSENLGNLWQGSSRSLRLQRQLSQPNLFCKEY